MTDYTRFAIYYLPRSGAFSRFGAEWLGWDVDAGQAVRQPVLDGIDLEAITRTPRKYGFHATLKPPFRLLSGRGEVELQSCVADLADQIPPAQVEGLMLERLGRFIAVTIRGNQTGVNAIAAACVTELDHFRAPAPPEETERRRSAGLSPRQDSLLQRWGYPYVMDQFRFHMTLTGKLEPDDMDTVFAAASRHAPALDEAFVFDEIALVGERPDGLFETIKRFPLTGNPRAASLTASDAT